MPNGIAYILLNRRSQYFSKKENRKRVRQKIFSSDFPMRIGIERAYQIPQPGLVGRMTQDEENSFRAKVLEEDIPATDSPTLVWSIPAGEGIETDWHRNFVSAMALNHEIFERRVYPHEEEWANGEVDATFNGTDLRRMPFVPRPSGLLQSSVN